LKVFEYHLKYLIKTGI